MKKLIVCLVMLCATMAYATNDDVVNSQMYVDNLVGNLQTNLPAKTSDKVATYTTTAGTTGERDIKTTLGNETTNQADTGIPTTGTVNTALDDKQSKLNPLNNVNIVTYTGSQNDSNNYKGRGIVTTTPIYDSTVNTFDNGLVRAKTLNDAVIAGVNAEATKIQTPKGALWSFNRTAPKVLPTTANLPANIQGYSYCFRNVQPNGQNPYTSQGCSAALYSQMELGDWAVSWTGDSAFNTGIDYGNDTCSGSLCGKEVHGISACIDERITIGAPVPSTNTSLINKLNTAYESGKTGATPNGGMCYCKLKNPSVAGSSWVFITPGSVTGCANNCAYYCAGWMLTNYGGFRGAVFGAAPVSAQ